MDQLAQLFPTPDRFLKRQNDVRQNVAYRLATVATKATTLSPIENA
ncbi:hypothetical protein RRSWK_03180 [Rhodopirellula sp. SWK7]|nr:hypothetical protein RRSWK_03180 [Rhodopirellula sp. SWK7]